MNNNAIRPYTVNETLLDIDHPHRLAQDLRNELIKLRDIYQKRLGTPFVYHFKDGASVSAQYLNQLMLSPRINEIEFDAELSSLLGSVILYMIIEAQHETDNPTQMIANALFSPKIAHLISPNGHFGLGRLLTNAAYSSNLFFVNALLGHPKARDILSQQLDFVNPIMIAGMQSAGESHLEKRWNLDQCGFTESLFAAIVNDDYHVIAYPQLNQVLQSIIDFAERNQIDFNVNEPFGLAETLVVAAGKNNGEQVPVILNIPASRNIRGNAFDEDSGGLDNALVNAAMEGCLVAVQLILNHPNAHEISLRECFKACQEAQKKNVEVAAHIQAFIDRMG